LDLKRYIVPYIDKMSSGRIKLMFIEHILDKKMVNQYLVVAGYRSNGDGKLNQYYFEVYVLDSDYEFKFVRVIKLNAFSTLLRLDTKKFKFLLHSDGKSTKAGKSSNGDSQEYSKNHKLVYPFIIDDPTTRKPVYKLGAFRPERSSLNCLAAISLPDGILINWGPHQIWDWKIVQSKIIIFMQLPNDKSITHNDCGSNEKMCNKSRQQLHEDSELLTRYRVYFSKDTEPNITFNTIGGSKAFFNKPRMKQYRLFFKGLKSLYPHPSDTRTFGMNLNLRDHGIKHGQSKKTTLSNMHWKDRLSSLYQTSNKTPIELSTTATAPIPSPSVSSTEIFDTKTKLNLDLNIMAQKLEDSIGLNSFDLKHYTYIFEPKKYFQFPIYSISYIAHSQIEQKEGAIQPMPMIRGLKNITRLMPRKTPDV
jgi:hypothetical protein